MKSAGIVTLAILFCLAGASSAQVTLHFDDFPFQVGTEVTRGHGDNSIAPGPTGGAMSWDYSALAVAYELTESYLDPAGLPGADIFPTATLAMTVAFDGDVGEIGFFEEVGGNIELVGFTLISGGNPYPVPTTVNGPRFQFPMNYGDSWDYVGTTLFGNETHIDSTRFVVDAWGTMTEAMGVFSCLRLRMDRTHTILPDNTVTTNIRYMWVAQNWGEVCLIESEDDETDPDFDNGNYERISTNSSGTPVLLDFFEADCRDGGVDLAWRARNPRPGTFSLRGRRDDRTWPVAFAEGGDGRFSARDENAWLHAGGEVVYDLSLDGEPLRSHALHVAVPSGIYVVRLKTEQATATKKVTLMR